jgi:hypothetical protein
MSLWFDNFFKNCQILNPKVSMWVCIYLGKKRKDIEIIQFIALFLLNYLKIYKKQLEIQLLALLIEKKRPTTVSFSILTE